MSRARYIVDLLDVHAEDLAFLASQRRTAIGSRRHTIREFAELNERVEAHLQGLLVAPIDVLRSMSAVPLAGSDRDAAFAAAYALLRTDNPDATHAVLVEFTRAKSTGLAGLRDAFSLAPPARFAAEIQSALDHAKPMTAASAAVVLANHRLLDAHSARLAQLLVDPDPTTCELAWRAALLIDVKAMQAAPKRPFNFALSHASPSVRDAGWSLAAWTGQDRAMPLLRQLAADADATALHWLAVLGDESDAPLLQRMAIAQPEPAIRCALVARHGHPSVVGPLLDWMIVDDVALAASAGEAFMRMTGVDIRGERRQLPVADDADDFVRAMSPDVWMPDVTKARAVADRHGSAWTAGKRWCRGRRLDGDIGPELLRELDLEVRWESGARAAMAGLPICAPPPIH